MSQENVELAHRTADAFNRRDIDAFVALCDPDVEFTTRATELEGGDSHRGHDGVRSWCTDILEVFPDFSIEIQEVRDLGNVTVARQRLRGRGTGSDALTEDTAWTVTEWRHGRAVWSRVCGSQAEALEAVGLSE